MPGPFPGMDPYLEDPAGWQGTHNTLIAYLWTALNALLPPEYIAKSKGRRYVLHPDRQIVPDVIVMPRPPDAQASLYAGRGGAAVAERVEADTPITLRMLPMDVKEMYLNIVSSRDGGRVVATIELLSHTNKTLRNKGRRLYLQKQRQFLASNVHLIEIDLLRAGEPTVAAPHEPLLAGGRWDYIASLHRGGQSESIEAWPVTIRQRLPRISVPLANGDADIVLDLQAVLDRYYDDGRYLQNTDYTREPNPALRGEDAVWADALLRENGLRARE